LPTHSLLRYADFDFHLLLLTLDTAAATVTDTRYEIRHWLRDTLDLHTLNFRLPTLADDFDHSSA